MHFCQINFPETQHWLDPSLAQRTYNGFQLFTELNISSLPWHERPYLIWLQPNSPGPAFTTLLYFSLHSALSLFGQRVLHLFYLSQCCSRNWLFHFSFCILQDPRIIKGLSWHFCAWTTTMQCEAISLRQSPRLLEDPPGQLSKSRTGQVSSWGMGLLCL